MNYTKFSNHNLPLYLSDNIKKRRTIVVFSKKVIDFHTKMYMFAKNVGRGYAEDIQSYLSINSSFQNKKSTITSTRSRFVFVSEYHPRKTKKVERYS